MDDYPIPPSGSWLYAGPKESFPDIASMTDAAGGSENSSRKLKLTDTYGCDTRGSSADADTIQEAQSSACKIFRKPLRAVSASDSTSTFQTTSSSSSSSLPTLTSPALASPNFTLEPLAPEAAMSSVGLEEQVLIFKYRGKIHAIDHQCPHRSYPLSKGSIYDIEDFGIVLSAGIMCPKHGWTFDLFTGDSDRGSYQLGVWDVEVRKKEAKGTEGTSNIVEEVWIRKT